MYRGFAVGIALSGLLCVLLLGVLFPTSEYRARLTFLLNGGVLAATIAAASTLLGIVVLLRSALLSPYSIGAIAVAAALNVSLLSAGAYAWMPELHGAGVRIAAVILAVGAVTTVVAGARRTGTG